jgi:hypothetical protein
MLNRGCPDTRPSSAFSHPAEDSLGFSLQPEIIIGKKRTFFHPDGGAGRLTKMGALVKYLRSSPLPAKGKDLP